MMVSIRQAANPITGSASSGMLIAILGFLAGVAVGWYFFSPIPAADGQTSMLEQNPSPAREKTGETGQLIAIELNEFERLERRAIALITQRSYVAALAVLGEAELVARSEAEIAQLTSLLLSTVQQRVDQLEALRQFGAIDSLYESLTLGMPERAEYYILLGELRIRLDDPEAALPVLAQIENHHRLGGRARELIDSITRIEATSPLAEIPLIVAGDQYLIEVLLDDRQKVILLIDTGASMTVVHPSVLTGLGYRLGGRSANFATANGVVRAPLVTISSLSLGGRSVQPMVIGALSIARGNSNHNIDGLLGMDFLKRFEFSIDQDAGVLNLLSLRG